MLVEFKNKPADFTAKIKNLLTGAYIARMANTDNEILIVVSRDAANMLNAMYCYIDGDKSKTWVYASDVNNYSVKNPQPVYIEKIIISTAN